MKIEKTSRRSPAPTRPTPARDSNPAVVSLPPPPKAPDGLVKLKPPGKPPVKFPVNVRVKVVNVPVVPVPVTNLREGLPIMTRTRPTAIRATLPMTSLLTKILLDF